ncbi:hypothetical protein [Edaphocola aurantiacus]|uniref:hypothetical protein n=1 Tax=Edaphocola aurantiacus TaxID=2601682 RepID=UPI001C975AA2|nr:hypothetical protein [Edaphocola aurantiacus]
MKRFLYLLAFTSLSMSALAQRPTTRTTKIKGNEFEWEMVFDKVKTVSQYTKKDTVITVQNRGHLLRLNGQAVSSTFPPKTLKTLEKYLKKSIAKAKMPALKFNDKDLRVHFSNCVMNEAGKIVYYEVYFFPSKDDLQLYPNEYTPEVKTFIAKMENIMNQAPLFPSEPAMNLYLAEPIILVD